MGKLKRDMSTIESQEFWANVERAARGAPRLIWKGRKDMVEVKDDDRLRDPEADEAYIRAAMKLIEDELRHATAKFGQFASQHEGIAIIEEEFLELREAVFWGHKNGGEPAEEAIQLGAMAARFLVDLVIPHVEAEALDAAETRA